MKPTLVNKGCGDRYQNANSVKDVKNIVDSSTYVTIGEDITFPDNQEDEITLYFTNSQNWSKVYIYFWGSENEVLWPGAEMEFVENNLYGQDVYRASIPADTTGVVFSAGVGMPQTVDIITGILNGHGFYPTETANGKWKVENYIYESNAETVATTANTIPNITIPKDNDENTEEVRFDVVEEFRVEGYGSDDQKLYLVRTVAEFKAVLDTIESSSNSDYYQKPTISEKYDDAYFMSDALLISLSCVGGSNCYQTIDNVTVNGDTLTLHRSLFKPDIVLCDMNYQYVLMEVDLAGIGYVQNLTYSDTHIRITE